MTDNDPVEARVLQMEARHIAEGTCGNPEHCAVAALIREHVRLQSIVKVSQSGADVLYMVGNHQHRARWEWQASDGVAEFITAFDRGENPAPIAVPLALPRSAWRVPA